MRSSALVVVVLCVATRGAGAADPSPPPLPEAPYRFSVLMDQWRPTPEPLASLRHPGAITREVAVEHVAL